MVANFTLDDVYNETSTKIIKIIYEIIFTIQLLLGSLVIYLILFKSQNMKVYRWYIFSEILFGTSSKIVLISMHIVILSPFQIAIFIGPMESVVGR
jgi:hypothetical protein